MDKASYRAKWCDKKPVELTQSIFKIKMIYLF